MSATRAFDVIVIGGGHNGLVSAAMLARAGLRTIVLEGREQSGGALQTTELSRGASVPAMAHTVGRLAPLVAHELDLAGHGLRLVQPAALLTTVGWDGPALTLWTDPARSTRGLESISGRDAQAWPAVDAEVRELAGVLWRLMLTTPPDPRRGDPDVLAATLRLAWRYRRLGAARGRELTRVLPQSVADALEDRFESDGLRAALATRALRYTAMGPRMAGTMAVLLTDSAGAPGGMAGETVYARGGAGAVAAALESATRAAGASVRTRARVASLRVRDDRVLGVVLADGEQIDAPIVVSSLSPRATLAGLLDPEVLGPELGWEVDQLRDRGATAKVNLALAGLPRFRGLDGDDAALRLRGRILVAPSMAYLERAADAAKYGRVSDEPWLEATIPSLVDPLLVDGARTAGIRHVMSVIVQSAPYHLREGSWDQRREWLGDLVVRTLDGVAPGLGALVAARQVLTPLDIERELGLPGGHPLHLEAGLDQWFAWRPLWGFARYRLPVEGLYLGGAGAHPGGGVTGLPGRAAARAVLSDIRRRRRRA
jgi:phytoene dehydrogenase-like protein